MKVKIYLFIIFSITSCKLWCSKLNNTMKKPNYIASSAVGVKGMLESAVKIKALSNYNNLKDMAEKVKTAAIISRDRVLSSKTYW